MLLSNDRMKDKSTPALPRTRGERLRHAASPLAAGVPAEEAFREIDGLLQLLERALLGLRPPRRIGPRPKSSQSVWTHARQAKSASSAGVSPRPCLREEAIQAALDRFQDRVTTMTAAEWVAAMQAEDALLTRAAAERVERMEATAPPGRVDVRLLPPAPSTRRAPKP